MLLNKKKHIYYQKFKCLIAATRPQSYTVCVEFVGDQSTQQKFAQDLECCVPKLLSDETM
jgi:hypothetical protein